MDLFKRNSGLMLKTFLYQVVMSLFGFMMYSATYKIPFILVVGQACVLIFYFYIMSSQMYKSGGKMCEYDHGHSVTSSPYVGFLFALIAFLPTIILSVVSIVIPPFSGPETTNTAGYLSYLFNHTFQQGMYLGITQSLAPNSANFAANTNADAINLTCFYHLIGALPGILACGIGYLVGYKNFLKDKKKAKK